MEEGEEVGPSRITTNIPRKAAVEIDEFKRNGRTYAPSRDAFVRMWVEAGILVTRGVLPLEAAHKWVEKRLLLELTQDFTDRQWERLGFFDVGPATWLRKCLLLQRKTPPKQHRDNEG